MAFESRIALTTSRGSLRTRTIPADSTATSVPALTGSAKADEIYDTILKVFAIAKKDKVPTYVAADRLAEQRMVIDEEDARDCMHGINPPLRWRGAR